eukprot:GFUD01021274.1.p1 GENE.GFUD01021274.1~~GFUD01021274.1.p1  ORF type:complete len:618 (+),score=188.57 GFUD01021274.1:152-2005(+)
MSSNRDTPGRRLIEDLLAKNVAKYVTEDEVKLKNENKETFGGNKRKTSTDDFKKKKKTKLVEQEDKYSPNPNFISSKDDFKFAFKIEGKLDNLEYSAVKVESHEYTEIEYENSEIQENIEVETKILPKTSELDTEDDDDIRSVPVKIETAKNYFNDVTNESNCEFKRNKTNMKNSLILDLLAKSIAKINAGEDGDKIDIKNKETLGRKKNGGKRIKKKHKGKTGKDHDSSPETDSVKCEFETEDFKLVEVKSDGNEYTEKLWENFDVKVNFLGKPIKSKIEIDRLDVSDTITVPVKPKVKDSNKIDFKDVTNSTKCVKTNTENTICKLAKECNTKHDDRDNQDNTKETKEETTFIERRKRQQMQRKSGLKPRSITPEEDKIILDEIDKFGDNINISQLVKKIGRTHESVRRRINKLQIGKLSIERNFFRLAEDLVIMDAVLPQLPERSLEMLELPNGEWNSVGDQLGRSRDGRSLGKRWEFSLKPWLLQHFSGTLNLDIRRMLANYLAEHFEDIDSIDWFSVARKPKFAGHTLISLRNQFFNYLNLFKTRQDKTSKDGNSEVTLKDVADFTNARYKFGLCTVRPVKKNTLTRQKEIIDYFEQYVKKQGVEMFDVYSK